MNEYSEDFKGVWFPRSLWLDGNISLIEKGILVVIKNLDKSDDHCRATNNYLADFFQCNSRTIIRAIGHLKELGYIEEVEGGKTGVCRKLKVKVDIENPGQNVTPDKMSPVTKSHGGGDKMSGVPVTKCHPNNIVYNNINNNIIGEQKNFSDADASPTSEVDVKTELVDETPKTKRKTKKQQRYEEVVTSTEFNTLLHEGLSEKDFPEIDTLRGEYVELRCSKDYRAFTDGAIKRNLKVLTGTSVEERKAIIEKSVVKGRTGLFPLNDYDKKHLEEKEVNVEGSDARLYKKIFDTKCKEKEDELPEGTTHNLLMDLVQKYGEERVRAIYYDKVRPQILSIYGIKRDWVK